MTVGRRPPRTGGGQVGTGRRGGAAPTTGRTSRSDGHGVDPLTVGTGRGTSGRTLAAAGPTHGPSEAGRLTGAAAATTGDDSPTGDPRASGATTGTLPTTAVPLTTAPVVGSGETTAVVTTAAATTTVEGETAVPTATRARTTPGRAAATRSRPRARVSGTHATSRLAATSGVTSAPTGGRHRPVVATRRPTAEANAGHHPVRRRALAGRRRERSPRSTTGGQRANTVPRRARDRVTATRHVRTAAAGRTSGRRPAVWRTRGATTQTRGGRTASAPT
ncbi:hypothetical protein SAMN05192554_12312 [Haloarchaeobius iranensis]|uniref:Uncharacterized protein n=1 Tax=Haloarchaeobius iranensis TaxID=996166 RepID=A0A1G9ZX27_9EURY|nr:hypothetical protein SAMN05192554_12312 [Haloarchaeobius iranensis]